MKLAFRVGGKLIERRVDAGTPPRHLVFAASDGR